MNRTESARKKIGILSPCGTGNLGDEATVAVLLEEIKHRYPAAEVYGLTTDPKDTQRLHGIPAYPTRNIPEGSISRQAINQTPPDKTELPDSGSLVESLTRELKKLPLAYTFLRIVLQVPNHVVNLLSEARFIVRSLNHLKGTDLLVVAGSGQLLDAFGGTWGFPYTLLKWSVMARFCGTKLAFLSCGAGPIDAALSKRFIKWALNLADYRSFRDQDSKDLIEKIGVSANDPVTPDLVFSASIRRSGPSKPKVVAINPIPSHDPRYSPASSLAEYSSYLNRLASFVSWLIKRNYTVLLFPTQLRADPLVISDLKIILMKDPSLDLEKLLQIRSVASIDDVIEQISMADLVVASRFHGVLVSFLLGKPVLALSHHPKVSSLMQDMGQSDYLLNIDTFNWETAVERFSALESKKGLVSEQLRVTSVANRYRLEAQYNKLFSMVFPGTRIPESVRAKSRVLN